MAGLAVRVLAFAKLNLNLAVCGERSDGFHNIRSVVQTIDLADRLEFTLASDVRVCCTQPLVGENIVARAIDLLLSEKGTRTGIHITIDKRIPIGAGLGGGSSDAAAALAVVNQLVPPVLPEHCVLDIAAGIGSDVSLFLQGGCTELSGRGDPGAALPIRSESYVLLVPPLHCSTRDIYHAWISEDTRPGPLSLGRNDLFPPAARLYPELHKYKAAAANLGGLFSGMTGSGSAFFAVFGNRERAMRAERELTRQMPECRVYCCETTATGFAKEGGEV